ncbi:hypothetical protein JCM10212_005188 [Sporobolomyces blumeae]
MDVLPRKHKTTLTTLPADVIVEIATHLDFASLARLSRVHSKFRSTWRDHEDYVNRVVAIRTGLADTKTCSAASPALAPGWDDPLLVREGGARLASDALLVKVIAAQRCISGTFDGVQDWTAFAKLRYKIDRNWTEGRHKRTIIRYDRDTRAGLMRTPFWRFKVDPVAKWIVATGVEGGTWAFDVAGSPRWTCIGPTQPYPHVELTYDDSTSYLSMSITRQLHIIWRYEHPSDPPPAPAIDDQTSRVFEALSVSTRRFDMRGYAPFRKLSTTRASGATKLRFPYFLATSTDSTTAYRFDLTSDDGSPRVLDLTPSFLVDRGETEVHYAEMDEESIFVNGLCSTVRYSSLDLPSPAPTYQLEPRLITAWPPDNPPEYRYLAPLVPEPHYRQNSRLQAREAVHHDANGGHLVSIAIVPRGVGEATVSSTLVWTCDYKRTLSSTDPEEIEQRTIVLVMDDVRMTQLSVENGRALFTAEHDELGTALFLVPLRRFSSLADFARDPPRPICLYHPLPLTGSPARIESTSTDVFVPINVRLANKMRPVWGPAPELRPDDGTVEDEYGRPLVDRDFDFPFPCRWQTLDGQTLVDYEQASVRPDSREYGAVADAAKEACQAREGAGSTQQTGMMRLSFAP